MTSNKIMIVGFGRSGTSLLRAILNTHPSIVIAPECGFAQWLYTKYHTIKSYKAQFDEIAHDISQSKKFETWNISASELYHELDDKNPQTYPQIVSTVYKLYARKVKDTYQIWGDKNNYYIQHLELLPKIYPEAHYIYIYRRPHSVIESFLKLQDIVPNGTTYKPTIKSNIKAIANSWLDANIKTILFLNQVGLKYSYISYDSIVSNTEESIKNICQDLSIEYFPKMQNPHIHNKIKEPSEYRTWKDRLSQPITKTTKIHKYLTEKSDITHINQIHEIFLKELTNLK